MLSNSSGATLRRQVLTTAAGVFCLVGTAVGTGLIGTPVAESSQGALAADATLVAPAGPAFSIWSVIYLGLVAFVVWQWFPGPARSDRARALGYLPAVTMVLNAVWILVAQTGVVWLSAVVIVVLLAALGLLVRRLSTSRPHGPVPALVVDGTFGLYLGWVAVATCANLTAALVAGGVRPGGVLAAVLGVLVVLAAAAVAVLLAWRFGGRLAVGLAMGWGLAWIAVGRLADQPASTSVGVAAVVGALVALLAAVARRRPGTAAVPVR